VIGDEDSLRIMLGNLIDNAIRHTPDGGTITTRVAGDNADAMLEVEDTGPGIPADQRERVFDRFYRVPGHDAGEDGSGLGLAIVKRVVERHRGHIELKSGASGTGLRVAIRLPAGKL
jgi:two-component system, OmpR family, sensor kinase